jgi:hypothetical protein
MLLTPAALPIACGSTELTTAACTAGIAIDTPQPAKISGAISLS